MVTVPRGIVGTLVLIVGLLIVAACAPAAELTPMAAPTKPAPTPVAKPAEFTPLVAKPAGTVAPKPTPVPEWKVEWDKVLAAAKKEGKVVVFGPRGELYREATMGFRKAYPDIQIDLTTGSGGEFASRFVAERGAGQYLWDVFIGGATSAINAMIPNKLFDPLRPALILPEVLDDTKWHQGFEAGWMDLGAQYLYAPLGYVEYTIMVNRDVAPTAELRTLDDLLEPKWKGKIAWQDPRKAGAGSNPLVQMFAIKGEDWMRKLLAQDIATYEDARLMTERLMRGGYAIALGVRPVDMTYFRELGLLGSIEAFDPSNPATHYLSGGALHLSLFGNAPNPNAAKVFINWLLSQSGQKTYVDIARNNSRRLDVEGPPETAPRPGVKYVCISHEENERIAERAGIVAKEVLK